MRKLVLILLSFSALTWVSCGGGGGGGGNPPPPAVTISISPTTATVEIGDTAQFTATVRNTTNTAVTWQVNTIDGGNTTVGTISTAGLYTAPASVPDPAAVTVKAISQADSTKSAFATVTIKLRITVTPGTATVPAVGTQQFTVLVEGVANTDVEWQVNGTPGGSSSLGTISAAGLFTAPSAIPAGGAITVSAVAQADTSKSDSVVVAVVHSPAQLSGQYAIAYWGRDSDGLIYAAGSIIADGNGTITGGILDLNAAVGLSPNLGLSGTYSVSEDGRAEFLLVDSDTFTYTLRAVFISPDQLHVIQFDTFAAGTGVIERQDPASFTDAAFAGGYALRFEGVSLNGFEMFAGRMTADGAGGLSAGVMDINDSGVDTRAAPFTGVYNIAANGRGTVSLDTGAAMGVVTFAVYMVSSGKAHFVSLDSNPAFLGTAERQSLASFSNANLSGDYVFNSAGFGVTGFVYNVGRFTANGNGATSAGVTDENGNGMPLENLAFTGAYSVVSNGRGTAAFTFTFGTTDYSFYMVSPGRAFFVQHGAYIVACGDLDAQQGGPFSAASVAGDFGLLGEGLYRLVVGQFNATGSGAASGTLDINDAFDGPLPGQLFDATYSVSSNGRGNFSVTGTDPLQFHIYTISPSRAVLIGIDSALLVRVDKRF
jgi:hypothetical protein